MLSRALLRPSVPSVRSEHAGETSWLLGARERFCALATTSPRALRRVDVTLAAHADALSVQRATGSPAGEAPDAEEPPELPPVIAAFVDARAAIAAGDGAALAAVLDRDLSDRDLLEAIPAAFAWTSRARGGRLLRALVAAELPPGLVAVGLGAHAARARDPGRCLSSALLDDARPVQRAAAECAARVGRVDAAPRLQELVADARGASRALFLAAAAVLGDRRSREALVDDALVEGAAPALRSLGLRLGADGPRMRPLLDRLRGEADRRALWVEAAGASGDPSQVDRLIEAMSEPAIARGAGLAFELITGIEVRGALQAPGDEAADEDPLRDRPVPRAEAIAAVWKKRRGGFSAGGRYLLGGKPTEGGCRAVLDDEGAPRAHREAAALELVRLDPRHGWRDVDAPRVG